jgi:hypothetical protein
VNLRFGLPLAIVAALTLASSAHAASPGVNLLGGLGNPDLSARAIESGAKEIRIFIDWSGFEPKGPGEFPIAPRGPDNLADGAYNAIAQMKRAGRKVMVVITGAPGWANGGQPSTFPPTPDHIADYASFAQTFVRRAANAGTPIDDLEVWNEPEGSQFWLPGPDIGRYTALLKATYAAVKDAQKGDPSVRVWTGPTTGNNYEWIQQLYDNGAKGSFDGVSVHTDTACLVAPPDSFYRDDKGKLARFTFLGYREVRAVMLANGDDKPIAMSELGWSSTNGDDKSCQRGTGTNIKANGVSAQQQADDLSFAFRCLAIDPYVQIANWFQLTDTSTVASDELGHYGLFDTGLGAKPSLGAFKAVAAADGGGPGACGDFDPPALKVLAPNVNEQFVDKLDLQASATDTGVGLARISFFVDGQPQEITNFTTDLKNGGAVGLAPWQGSGKLAIGAHTIKVLALDKNGNQSVQTVNVQKVTPGSIKATLVPKFKLPKKVSCRGHTCTIKGQLLRGVAGSPSIGGKVSVEWQFRNKKGQWRRLSGGLKAASKPFTFTAKLKKKGSWRVRVVYAGLAPWKPVKSTFLTFRLR